MHNPSSAATGANPPPNLTPRSPAVIPIKSGAYSFAIRRANLPIHVAIAMRFPAWTRLPGESSRMPPRFSMHPRAIERRSANESQQPFGGGIALVRHRDHFGNVAFARGEKYVCFRTGVAQCPVELARLPAERHVIPLTISDEERRRGIRDVKQR